MRPIQSATRAGLSSSSISTVIVRVELTAVPLSSTAEVTAEAARLNDKVKPWAYALAPWLVDRLTDRHQRLAP